MHRVFVGLGAPLAILAWAPSVAAPAKTPPQAEGDYGRNIISVATPGRTSKFSPTGDCLVWANAEGLGVGTAQLGGLHGMVMHINPRPLAGETATSFADGLAALKASYPNAPAWFIATLEKHRAAIEAGCAQDHPGPLKVAAITKADLGGK